MEIGISSACFYPDQLLEDSIKYMKKLGFNSGELFLNTICECEEDYILKIKEEIIKNDFNVESIHFFSGMYEPFLFDSYKRRREDALMLYKKICRSANLLGANVYSFHGMRLVNLEEINEKFTLDVYNELCYIAGENNILLGQENVSWCMSANISFLEMLKYRVKYPLKYTFDIKQAYKAKEDPLKYLDVMGKDLVNFHINDRTEDSICELPGNGSVNYSSIFNKLKEINYNNIAIIEVYRDNFNEYEELKKCREFLEKIL